MILKFLSILLLNFQHFGIVVYANRTPLTVRQHAYIQQRFGPIQARMLAGNFHRKEPIIYLVVALKSRANTFHRFLQNLDEISGNDNRHGIELVLVYYRFFYFIFLAFYLI